MTASKRWVTIVIAVGTLCGAEPLAAAPAIGSLRLPIQYRAWTVEPEGGGAESRVTQLVAPLVASFRAGPDMDVVLSGELTSSSLDASGEETTRSGLSGLGVSSFWRIPAASLQLNLRLAPASGARELEPDALRLTQALAVPLLGFPVRHPGSGAEASFGATWVRAWSERLTVGVGAAAVTRGPYELEAGSGDFRPAAEQAATLGVDVGTHEAGASSPARVDLTYRWFGADERDGQEVFEEGNQLELQGEFGIGTRDGLGATARVRGVLKQDNRVRDPLGTAVADYKAASGDALLARLEVERPMGRARATLTAHHGRVRGSDESSRNGNAFGIGPAVALPAGETMIVDLGGEWLWGTLFGPSADADSRLRGWSLHAGLRWSPAP